MEDDNYPEENEDEDEDLDGDSVQIRYNTTLGALEEVLDEVRRHGDYFCAGTHESPMPALEVEGVGLISFPVPPAQARAMIAQSAQRAPYGRGDRTLVDESVRRVWQVHPDRMRLSGKAWERHFEELVAKVAFGLGCEPGLVTAEFYKLLIYDKGGHFAAHRDTEKTAGMFGTLVVTLPSAHTGGDLVIRHQDQETVVSLAGDEPGEVRYTAFYADCEHEVRPVTGGHRVCLVYNLIHRPRTGLPQAPDNLQAVSAATEILSEWADTDLEPLKLVYLLDHHYTQATLSFAGLKGADAARAQVLREAADRSGCALHLGILHIEESGWAEFNGDYYGYERRSRWGRGRQEEPEEPDESEFEVGEVSNGEYYIDQWRNTDDQPVALGEIPLNPKETLPDGALEGVKPDQSHFSEATGNEGASFERTYLRAAFVLWPVSRFDRVCITGGLDAAVTRFGQLAAEAKQTARGSGERARLRHFLGLLPAAWTEHGEHSRRLADLLRTLADFGDTDLIRTAAAQVPLGKCYNSRQNDALLACAGVLGPKGAQELLIGLFTAAAARVPASCMDLWRRWAEGLPDRSKAAAAVLDILTAEAPKAKRSPHYPYTWLTDRDTGSGLPDDGDSDEDDEDDDDGQGPSVLTPLLLADFLTAASAADAALAVRFVEALSGNVGYYRPETLLLPCLKRLAASGPGSAAGLRLWRQCAGYYTARSAAPPEKPVDWAQSTPIRGADRNPHLRELERFARDPHAQEHRFTLNQDLRRVLHQAISLSDLDMTHVTERVGRPFTLVCTKTRATYERARRRYESDLADMRRLLALPEAESPDARAEAELLRKALANETPA